MRETAFTFRGTLRTGQKVNDPTRRVLGLLPGLCCLIVGAGAHTVREAWGELEQGLPEAPAQGITVPLQTAPSSHLSSPGLPLSKP